MSTDAEYDLVLAAGRSIPVVRHYLTACSSLPTITVSLVAASTEVAAAATIVAALAVGSVTIYTTNRRLASERQRQLDALNHDRAMADRADLRTLLDEAGVTLDRCTNTLQRICGTLEEIDPELVSLVAKRGHQEMATELEAVRAPIVTLVARLRLRLGHRDPITIAVLHSRDALDALIDILSGATSSSANDLMLRTKRLKPPFATLSPHSTKLD